VIPVTVSPERIESADAASSWYDDGMRTIIDLRADQVAELEQLCQHENISRAEAIRRAVDTMIQAREIAQRKSWREEGFGSWGPPDFDAREFIDELRSEWDDRERRLGLDGLQFTRLAVP